MAQPEVASKHLEPASTADGRTVFLAPRVVDQRAYDQLAGELKALTDRATHAVEQIGPTAQRAVDVVTALQKASTAHTGNLETFHADLVASEKAAVRIQRSQRAADAAAARLETAAQHAEQAEQRLAETLRRAGQATASLEAHLELVTTSAADATERSATTLAEAAENAHAKTAAGTEHAAQATAHCAHTIAQIQNTTKACADTNKQARLAHKAATKATLDAGEAADRLEALLARVDAAAQTEPAVTKPARKPRTKKTATKAKATATATGTNTNGAAE